LLPSPLDETIEGGLIRRMDLGKMTADDVNLAGVDAQQFDYIGFVASSTRGNLQFDEAWEQDIPELVT
jgi:hypothetical protein